MTDETRIDVQELRDAPARVLDQLEARFGPTVDLDADGYWTLDPQAAFAIHREPGGALTVAQLSDDVHEVRDLLARSGDVVIWHDLSHLVGILTRIAALDLP